MSADRPAPRAAYLHVPFCRHRCGYCNFTVIAGRDELAGDYLRGLEHELSRLETPRPVDSLFIGGGTPTQPGPDWLARLIALATRWFPLVPGYELSLEANPADLSPAMLDQIEALGVNRLSIGGQSFDAAKLVRLERDHTPEQLASAVEAAQRRVASVSVDLIFAVPGERLEDWQRDLGTLVALRPQHVSTYGLTYEKGAAFWARRARGELAPPSEASEGAMYEVAIDQLAAAGFEHYEVSNFAMPGHRCRHNEVYWLGQEYYAAGPGAARYVEGRRETNHRSTTTWMRRALAGQSVVAESEQLGTEDRARERLVFALRRMEGIEHAAFAQATGYTVESLVGPALHRFIEQGLLRDDGHRLRLTRAGLLVSDALWPAFLRR